ncbi:MAG: AAA family ATPase, partial [Leptospiraceae bacterium]|nr:AAA family ATPase [Leptospiraceae bacterium]
MQKISKEMNFEFASDDAQTGYRLDRMEVLNWGTFDNQIWKIEPNGFNSLLTGDIGSGKSTLVDAITTLLVQHNRITYNKA